MLPDHGSKVSQSSFRRVGFLLVNCWLVFHLFAILICPASTDPSSPLLQYGFEQVAPYLNLLWLNHGFHYFAPEPGSSTLVAYTLDFPDGTQKSGRFPNREIFPRLYYHRHFMLTEFLGNGPEELQPLLERAFARNLCRETGATRVTLTRVEHAPASMEETIRGLTLNDSSFFKETPLGTYTEEELRLPYVPVIATSASGGTSSDLANPDQSPDKQKGTP